MQHRSVGLFVLAAAAAVALPGSADATSMRRSMTVNVNLPATYASGALGTVRDYGGGPTYIGCSYVGTRTWVEGICYAQNDLGQYATCWTYEPNLLGAIGSITSDSFVSFSWMASGECYNVTVQQDSRDAPRTL